MTDKKFNCSTVKYKRMKLLMSVSAIIILLALYSCNNNADETVEEEKTDSVVQTDFCYTGIINRDTVLLNVNITDTLVTGGLIYNFYEKDDNKGSLSGKMIGDTMIADYKFYSSGMESMRQVAFLKKDSVMIQGFGPMVEKAGKMVFTRTSEINFGQSIVLKSSVCE